MCNQTSSDHQENVPRWKVASPSVTGTRHHRAGSRCDDAAGWFIAGELLCIAVADGAGSALQAALGSAVAVRAALLTVLCQHQTHGGISNESAPQILTAAFGAALVGLHEIADARNLEASDLATTLIVVLAGADFVAAAQVGDGAAVMLDADSVLLMLSTPTNGQFANETPLLGCGEFVDVSITTMPQSIVQQLAVFTDGVQRLALCMKSLSPHEGFFKPLFGAFDKLSHAEADPAIAAFLASARVNARTDDDKTMVLAQRL